MKHRVRIHKAIPNTGALNFSGLLDAPAGKHGFVQVKNGHLYFEDGLRARFIGFNLPTRSNTPDHETAEKLAARFASLGVNVIRLHAADAPIGAEPCSWSSCEKAPLIDYRSGSSRRFHPEGLDRFDYFCARLKEKGIYLHVDLLVARAFQEGDGLDSPGAPGGCLKCYTLINERLIELQKEYAKALLCHVNPYTGLRLIDDPAVMTIQINNEDSAIKGSVRDGAAQFYRDEFQRKFNHFLLMKYDTRERLAKAWTSGGVCALGDDEDPAQNTVRVVEGSFLQPANDPMGEWNGAVSPARYADFLAFGIDVNRRFYADMRGYLLSIGAKVPIATSNLLGGAADVYGHTGGDIMENNSYFNHPLLPVPGPDRYVVAGPTEYVSVNPLTMQRGVGALGTTLVSLAALAVVEGMPFVLSEWNEYGLHPFHSTAYVSTVAYACLNDWDGLILYCHHTSENWDDQPDDEIRNVFDFYNDPAVICPWGFCAAVFLKGLVSPAKHRIDIAYAPAECLTLPNAHAMPDTYAPYIASVRQVFMRGDRYTGNADAVINAGFLNCADLRGAKHGVYYAWSPYRDAFRRYASRRLTDAARSAEAIAPGVYRNDRALVFSDIATLSGSFDYRAFAGYLDASLKAWGVLTPDTGLVDGKLVSDTGEIVLDPDHSRFSVRAPACACFSGAPEGEVSLCDRVSVRARNSRVTLALLAEDNRDFAEAKDFSLTAVGETGMDQTEITPENALLGMRFSMVRMRGKLFAEALEGEILVRAKRARLVMLDIAGRVLREIREESREGGVCFRLFGDIAAYHYQIKLEP